MIYNVRITKDGKKQWCGIRFQVYTEKGYHNFFGEKLTEYVNVKNKKDKLTIRRYIDLTESKKGYSRTRTEYMIGDITHVAFKLLKEYGIEFDSFELVESY